MIVKKVFEEVGYLFGGPSDTLFLLTLSHAETVANYTEVSAAICSLFTESIRKQFQTSLSQCSNMFIVH